jgi:diguanylate cyclase (GGDEF)-like protein/PAS domain S-box-containing protein
VNSFPDDKYMIGITFLFILTTPILVLFGINIHNWIKENLAMLHEKQILAKKLQNDQEKLHLTDSALNNVNEGIIITTADMEIIYANEAFTRISGFTYEEVKGKPPEIFQSTGLNHRWSLSEKNGKWEGEVWNKRKDGQTYPALFNVIPMKNDLGQIKNYIIHFKDITDKKKQEDELRYFANFDDLTGLPNRKHIYDRLDIILNNKLENNFFGSILFLDINYFKIINDVYGHQTGDLLLKAVSERLKENLREDDMVGRLGGDEFVVILKNTGKDESIQISEKLIETISTPFYINDKKCNIGLSIGIALIPEHGSDRRTLMHHADTAMYQAKLQNESTHWVIFKETAKV